MNTQDFGKWSQYYLINLSIIVIFGFIVLYSSSYMYARETFGSSFYLVGKQGIFFLLSLGLAFVLTKTRFSFWYHHSLKIHLLICFLLLLTFVPGIGLNLKGSHRWLNLGFMTLQPGEFIKYSTLLTSLYFFENFKNFSKESKIIYFACLLAPLGILILQPDFGTFAICLGIIFFTGFLSNLPRKYFVSSFIVGLIGFITLLTAAPYRVKRLMSFLDPWADPQNTGFQIIQSYLAFANGSLFGRGLGGSVEKLFYLPEAYNDFIFSVLGEELGLMGVILLTSLFLAFLYLGFKLALQSKVQAGKIFIAAVTFLICLQAFLNMGIVLGLLPTKGLNLPFVSYGGSSLLANTLAIGLVFSLKRYEGKFQQSEFEFKENPQMSRWTRNIA
ncbi:MAG: putative lipid II flippase FtsW [Halobacteriovoraceae bacterium]|nr:putative lipid II flippase FtsW [Halobacteriovoraceae bacterium]